MKKISLICSALLLGTIPFISCTDMLDEEPLDEFVNNAEFWGNEATVEGYANTFYNQFVGYGTSGNGDFYFPSLTDDQVSYTFTNWTYINVPASISDWKNGYAEIRRSNVMIDGLEKYGESMDSDVKNHWLGVARMMRAYQYWNLVRKFGDCVWVDKPLDVNSPELYVARTDRDEVMDKVFDDIDFAAKNINQFSSNREWSRELAQAMKARICLWEGTFRKYRTAADNGKAPDEAGAKRFLEACVDACSSIMPEFSLCADYQSIYNSTDLSSNPEIIFCKPYQQDVMAHSTINWTCMSTPINGMSKDAFDSYLKLDGTLPVDGVDDVGVWKQNGNDGASHIDIQNILDNRDKRLAKQIDPVLCYQGLGWPRKAGGTPMVSSTGYTVSKFDNLSIPDYYRVTGSQNYTWAPLFWLAEVYLNFAEAKAELGTITDDDLNKSVNLLKDRAGLPHLTTAAVSLGDDNKRGNVPVLIWEIRRERRCELMYDNNFRYWDLIRWHQLDKLDTSKNPDIAVGANISIDPTAVKQVSLTGNGYIDASNGLTRTYEPRYYLYPIPSGQMTLNDKLEQNPLWVN